MTTCPGCGAELVVLSPKQRANLRLLSLHGAGIALPLNEGDALIRRGWATVRYLPMTQIYAITEAGREAYAVAARVDCRV